MQQQGPQQLEMMQQRNSCLEEGVLVLLLEGTRLLEEEGVTGVMWLRSFFHCQLESMASTQEGAAPLLVTLPGPASQVTLVALPGPASQVTLVALPGPASQRRRARQACVASRSAGVTCHQLLN